MVASQLPATESASRFQFGRVLPPLLSELAGLGRREGVIVNFAALSILYPNYQRRCHHHALVGVVGRVSRGKEEGRVRPASPRAAIDFLLTASLADIQMAALSRATLLHSLESGVERYSRHSKTSGE